MGKLGTPLSQRADSDSDNDTSNPPCHNFLPRHLYCMFLQSSRKYVFTFAYLFMCTCAQLLMSEPPSE